MPPFCKHFFLCFPFHFLHLLLPCFWPFNLLPPPLFLPLLDIAPPPLALCPSEQTTRQANKRMAIRILTLCFFQVIELIIPPQSIVKKKRVSHGFSIEYCRIIVLYFDWPRRIVFSKHSFHLIWRYWNRARPQLNDFYHVDHTVFSLWSNWCYQNQEHVKHNMRY